LSLNSCVIVHVYTMLYVYRGTDVQV